MKKMNPRNLFDRMGIYRLAGLFLAIVFIRSIVVRIMQTGGVPFTGWTLLFWAGFLLLMFNLVRDGVYEYKARRSIHRMIKTKVKEKA